MVEIDSVPGAGGTQTAQVVDEEMVDGGPYIALPATDLKWQLRPESSVDSLQNRPLAWHCVQSVGPWPCGCLTPQFVIVHRDHDLTGPGCPGNRSEAAAGHARYSGRRGQWGHGSRRWRTLVAPPWLDHGQISRRLTTEATVLVPAVVGGAGSGVVLSRSYGKNWRWVQYKRSQGDC